EPDRPFAGVGHGSVERFPVVSRVDVELDDALAVPRTDDPRPAGMPRRGASTPLILHVVVVAAVGKARPAKPDRPLAGVRHGAVERRSAIRGFDLDGDRVLSGTTPEHPHAGRIPRRRRTTPLILD